MHKKKEEEFSLDGQSVIINLDEDDTLKVISNNVDGPYGVQELIVDAILGLAREHGFDPIEYSAEITHDIIDIMRDDIAECEMCDKWDKEKGCTCEDECPDENEDVSEPDEESDD